MCCNIGQKVHWWGSSHVQHCYIPQIIAINPYRHQAHKLRDVIVLNVTETPLVALVHLLANVTEPFSTLTMRIN